MSACPVCDVGILLPDGWVVKIKLGMVIGLGLGHIVLDGDPAPSKKGIAPIFGPCIVAKRLD